MAPHFRVGMPICNVIPINSISIDSNIIWLLFVWNVRVAMIDGIDFGFVHLNGGKAQAKRAKTTTIIAITTTAQRIILTICIAALIAQANSGGGLISPRSTLIIAKTAATMTIQIKRCSTVANPKQAIDYVTSFSSAHDL
jgi:hypothetical protein